MRTTKRSALTSGAVTVLAGLLTTGGLCTIGATPALAATPPAVTRVAATPVAASTPRAIVQEIGNNQEVDAGHAFPQGLAVRAIDVYGNGVAGVPVTFTIEPTTASQRWGPRRSRTPPRASPSPATPTATRTQTRRPHRSWPRGSAI